MATDSQPRGALLLGSVPLPDTESVFHAVGPVLGRHLRRLPDGETGLRNNWFQWQEARFASCPQLERAPADAPTVGRRESRRTRPHYQLRPGVNAAAVRFDAPGYATDAIASYAVFARLKREGVIPGHCRFQVSLPTPLTPTTAFCTLPTAAAVEPAYEGALLGEIDAMVAAIPPAELAIQWDASWEMAIWEEEWVPYFEPARDGVIARLARIGARVPTGVELGYHLCYGDYNHTHWKQPADTARLVEVANALAAAARRPIAWLHLPVPRDRDDDAYFAPLAGLRLRPETELYLGLVHHTNGETGTRRRIAAARRVVPRFGVATECGLGRRAPETIPALLAQHAAVAEPLIL